MKKKTPAMNYFHLIQNKQGYRYSIDSLLLADFIHPAPGDQWVDLGTGSGVIPIAVAAQKKFKTCWAIEIQSALCIIAQQNLLQYNLLNTIKILEADIRELRYYFPAYSMDMVASNPPYQSIKAGRLNPDWEKSIARHELFLDVNDVLDAADYLMKKDGIFYMIYPYTYYDSLQEALVLHSLYPKLIRWVTHRDTGAQKFVLIKASKNKTTTLKEEHSFIIHNMNL